jgi:16S rRNA (guanine527-N7)-methyltransferase
MVTRRGNPHASGGVKDRKKDDFVNDANMFRDEIGVASRKVGWPLTDAEAESLAGHYRLLRRWDAKMNLTALKERETILRRHFLEPIAVSGLLGDEGRLLDLGSGNGFPAIPLKVLHPSLELVLVESSQKKSAFLNAVLQELRLAKGRVETRRVGGLADIADLLPCRYLTFRAIRGRDLLTGETGPILETGGRALFFVSPDEADDLRQRPIPRLRWVESRQIPFDPRSVVAVLEPA